MNYKYFISFCYRDSDSYQGFGNGTFVISKKIESDTDIKQITQHFTKTGNHKDLVILGISLLGVDANGSNNIN
ncbi:hypothetical protein IX317_001109 [Fusobacterium sp. DD29]|uniref:hypothetical protein n=1 Tax=unclassified Fusobacterium TaxID=2648384 RepID=UPI001B8D65CA|nr:MULTISPECIES: hypothetical protein [unclassified Fusobacterium]MBR8701307.1 hypothetical protein [Fusobacterium sp. DD45]MBR8711077.1 hypothetical protein [Fusobacterium sp. DD28]MBR8749435.1 hypothetical protein [Fusobacterium sp. DD29]MBR8771737.1 hypothetical protein [Fusobacterium sp. DD40]MBR8804732.1 hypothetical protein [Fusobacterium sp. DD13]MBR8814109.1 hypothetical protein [Fusobacterium sp. DD6]MBR8816237.1 hypothetical protein [Fusobacterium sp. DD1]MBR8818456.1 hypothetical